MDLLDRGPWTVLGYKMFRVIVVQMIARIAECTLLLRLGQAVKVKAKVAGEDWGARGQSQQSKSHHKYKAAKYYAALCNARETVSFCRCSPSFTRINQKQVYAQSQRNKSIEES